MDFSVKHQDSLDSFVAQVDKIKKNSDVDEQKLNQFFTENEDWIFDGDLSVSTERALIEIVEGVNSDNRTEIMAKVDQAMKEKLGVVKKVTLPEKEKISSKQKKMLVVFTDKAKQKLREGDSIHKFVLDNINMVELSIKTGENVVDMHNILIRIDLDSIEDSGEKEVIRDLKEKIEERRLSFDEVFNETNLLNILHRQIPEESKFALAIVSKKSRKKLLSDLEKNRQETISDDVIGRIGTDNRNRRFKGMAPLTDEELREAKSYYTEKFNREIPYELSLGGRDLAQAVDFAMVAKLENVSLLGLEVKSPLNSENAKFLKEYMVKKKFPASYFFSDMNAALEFAILSDFPDVDLKGLKVRGNLDEQSAGLLKQQFENKRLISAVVFENCNDAIRFSMQAEVNDLNLSSLKVNAPLSKNEQLFLKDNIENYKYNVFSLFSNVEEVVSFIIDNQLNTIVFDVTQINSVENLKNILDNVSHVKKIDISLKGEVEVEGEDHQELNKNIYDELFSRSEISGLTSLSLNSFYLDDSNVDEFINREILKELFSLGFSVDSLLEDDLIKVASCENLKNLRVITINHQSEEPNFQKYIQLLIENSENISSVNLNQLVPNDEPEDREFQNPWGWGQDE